MTNQKKREHDNGNNGYRCIYCGTNVNDWVDQPCVEREPDIVERLRAMYYELGKTPERDEIVHDLVADAIAEIKRLRKDAK